ncbi:hypothetical protein CIG75_14300 [Tumebacillus algifaecis]|uniref:YdhG-like domain-containing protein n=1 Tax=Tumebacillus algifaecis TaxID=1214604 RepID=A0A223D2Y0_9BACL|nr:DUF1801 domain-containing protein [Tumebacillus algifaecis]ASS76019.1 hypothetical protein CIG75_14300 [Tumebacillus algifaecis]
MASKRTVGKQSAKLDGHQQVVEFLKQLEHPLKAEIEEVRSIVLQAKEGITEQIKWNAPSFCFQNEDRVTFNLQGKGFFRLVFHCGAKKKAQATAGRLFQDSTGLLEWVADDRAIIKFTDRNDVEAKKDRLAEVVVRWLEVTS